MACNFNCQAEGLLKVTGNHVHCDNVSISEVVQARDVITDY